MIASAKNYTHTQKKNKKQKWTDRTVGEMLKTKLYDKITERGIHIHIHKKRKRKKIYISIYI